MIEVALRAPRENVMCGSCLKILMAKDNIFTLGIGPGIVSAARYEVLLCEECCRRVNKESTAALNLIEVTPPKKARTR